MKFFSEMREFLLKAIIFTVMRKSIYFIVIIGTVIFACNSNENRSKSSKNKSYVPSFINLSKLLTDEENDISFPTWFNDSIIKAHRIQKITRKSFNGNSFDEGEKTKMSSTVPREIREYYFDENGFLIQMNVHNYYDDREIGSVLFAYTGLRDRYGYAQVKKNIFVSKTDRPFVDDNEPIDPEERQLDFKMHVKRNNYNKCLVYQDMETGDYLFYITKQKCWGPLTIDTLLEPNPKDHLVLGNPVRPVKKYRVSNKINESDITIFSYFEKHPNTLDYWLKKEYPLDHKRNFSYSQKGLCNGYVDSTFSDELYITRSKTEIQYNKKDEPIRILHRKENIENKTKLITLEIFEYQKR